MLKIVIYTLASVLIVSLVSLVGILAFACQPFCRDVVRQRFYASFA